MLNFDVQNILLLHVLKIFVRFFVCFEVGKHNSVQFIPHSLTTSIVWLQEGESLGKKTPQYCVQIWVVTRECGFILQVLRQVDENLKQFNANYMILKDYLSEVQHKLKSLCQQVTQVILILPVHDCIDLSPWLRHCK